MDRIDKLGGRLRELRLKHGYSQEAVAKEMMVTPQAYSQYERGKRRPSYEMLVRLKYYYGVPLDYLILGEDELDKKLYDRLIFTEASKLPYKGKDELFHFIQYLAEKYRMNKFR